MSETRVTPDEAERVAKIVLNLLPLAGLMCQSISNDDAEMIGRAMDDMDDRHRHMEAGSVAYIAMGVDVHRDPTVRRQVRNVPIVRKVLELRELIVSAAAEEVKNQAAQAQREAFRKGVGL